MSPCVEENIFTVDLSSLLSLLKLHHISYDPQVLPTTARTAISHVSRKCSCQAFGLVFDDAKEMSFVALSTLLSASESTLPDSAVALVGNLLGLSASVCDSRFRVFAELSKRRDSLISMHSSGPPSTSVFNDISDLPLGSLLALAKSHGLDVGHGRMTRDVLKDTITVHLSTGRCVSREGLSSHLSYDTLKKLCFRLKAFLKRLKASKYPPGSANLLGSAKKARAREISTVVVALELAPSATNTRVETKENTFWLHVMAQSPGIYKILAKTFKVECVIKCKATLQRADMPNNSTNMIERNFLTPIPILRPSELYSSDLPPG
ncbi:hypothetical protein DFH09DRAFT_1108998 [Mycena vulgaris]|nr:hypothetical protein DFH09DRAFT_1108998 [Mycena vulgaris]